jgi:hypothetical protein
MEPMTQHFNFTGSHYALKKDLISLSHALLFFKWLQPANTSRTCPLEHGYTLTSMQPIQKASAYLGCRDEGKSKRRSDQGGKYRMNPEGQTMKMFIRMI